MLKFVLFSLLIFWTSSFVYGQDYCSNKTGEAKSIIDEALLGLQRAKLVLAEDKIPHAVSFHVLLSTDVNLGSSQTVVFDTVIHNNGNGYNSKTGHFTATNDGTYFFTSSFLKTPGTTDLHLQMIKNNDRISQGYAASGNGYEAGSMSAVVSLKAGDVVSIRHWPGVGAQTIRGAGWSAFTGYIIA